MKVSQLSFRETSKTPNRHGLSSSNLKMQTLWSWLTFNLTHNCIMAVKSFGFEEWCNAETEQIIIIKPGCQV